MYAAVRTAPGTSVSAGAFQAARSAAAALPLAAGSWSELTTKPYNSDAVNYRDPFWSNSSGGAGLVSGRMSAIATDGNAVYAGAADGGVWKSTDKGAHWTPIFDDQSRLSIGAIAIDPADHSIWVGTGEANTAFENYTGDGSYRSGNGGQTWALVGNRLDNSLVSRITFDGNGHVLVAMSNGLVRRNASDLTGAWETVLKPDPNPTGSPYRGSWMSDVRVRPGTNGQYVIAVLGWRGGTLPADVSYNGFYVSTTGGTAGSFTQVRPVGIAKDIGRTSLDYSADGTKLYSVVESSATTDLNGVYRSDTGTANGPWKLIANNAKLDNSPNTATTDAGSQAWYDQYVTVEPRTPRTCTSGSRRSTRRATPGTSGPALGPTGTSGRRAGASTPTRTPARTRLTPTSTRPSWLLTALRTSATTEACTAARPACARSSGGTTSMPPCAPCSTTTPASGSGQVAETRSGVACRTTARPCSSLRPASCVAVRRRRRRCHRRPKQWPSGSQ
jgi:hypothetical protein